MVEIDSCGENIYKGTASNFSQKRMGFINIWTMPSGYKIVMLIIYIFVLLFKYILCNDNHIARYAVCRTKCILLSKLREECANLCCTYSSNSTRFHKRADEGELLNKSIYK